MQTYKLTSQEITAIILNMGWEDTDARAFRKLARETIKNRTTAAEAA